MSTNETVADMRERVGILTYSAVKIEGIGSTFTQTKEILERGRAQGVSDEDLTKVLGIKHGLELLFSAYKQELTWDLYAKYNKLLGEGTVESAGIMRGPHDIYVMGNSEPYYPKEDIDVNYFNDLVDTARDSATNTGEAASNLFLLLCKAQFFRDGNKRSAQMAANHLLAHSDSGYMLVVTEDNHDQVLQLLVDFYEGSIGLQDASWDLGELAVTSSKTDFERHEDAKPGPRSHGLTRDRGLPGGELAR